MENYHSSTPMEFDNLPSVASLRQFLADPPSREEGFERYERELNAMMQRVGRELKEAELARYDVVDEAVVVDGVEYRRCLDKEPKRYLTSSGPVIVPR